MTKTRKQKACIPREDRAIQFFMQGMTKVDALVYAGYSRNTANQSQTVFSRPRVAAELERRQLALRKKSALTEEWVINRFMMIADSGTILARFKKVTPDGGLRWDFTGATEEELSVINELTVITVESTDLEGVKTIKTNYKVGTQDPAGALNSLTRIQGMFNDKVQFQGELSLVDRIIRGRARARIIDHDPEEGNNGTEETTDS